MMSKQILAIGVATIALLAALPAVADAPQGPPPPPPSVMKAISKGSPESAISPASSQPIQQEMPSTAIAGAAQSGASVAPAAVTVIPAAPVPAERPATNDDSAKLASEVPADVVGATVPDKKWLSEEVGPIATRPVDPASPSAGPVADEGTAAARPAVMTVQPKAETVQIPVIAPGDEPRAPDAAPVEKVASVPIDATLPAGADAKSITADAVHQKGQSLPRSAVTAPKIVTIKANFAANGIPSPVKMKGASAVPAGHGDGDRFALVLVDEGQRSGDTFVKFFKPAEIWFPDGKSCLSWARNAASQGQAIAPSGVQPRALAAVCLGMADDVKQEFWAWRQSSGAFSRSELMPAQAAFFRQVIDTWSASTNLAYQDFPDIPHAGE